MNLGIALWRLAEREKGTARLEEAIAAFRAALQEWTPDRAPIRWAMSTGNQGVATMLLAERLGDSAKARTAVEQIGIAFETTRDGGHGYAAAYYKAQLQKAQAVLVNTTKLKFVRRGKLWVPIPRIDAT